jgi:hypothetical protein
MITLHFGAAAIFAAGACLTLIHRTILARVLAIWLVRRKRDRAQPRDQNRKQDFRVISHGISLLRAGGYGEQKNRRARRRRKRLNISDFGSIKEGAMQRLPNKALRISVALMTIVAWLSISNHCAVGAMVVAKTQSPMAQMHCHGKQSSPAKKSGEEEMPCCKILRATLAGQGKTVQVASKDFLPIPNWIIAQVIFADKAQLHCPLQELDTGPPFVDSFAESVLQRSLFAHAPPVSLS